jgi:hypothetical protein
MLRTVATVLTLGAGVIPCHAQNLPPPGAYQPIPNFTGVGAGLQFREAINDRFSGAQPIAPSIAGPAFANLPPEQDGMLLFCKDCESATPCVSGGSGAFAFGQGGLWSCAATAWPASLTQNLLAGGHSINGSTSAGGDQINAMSLNGVLNAASYGAICSDTTESATTTASNPVVTVSAIGDFKIGQYVKLAHAAAANALATPAITSVLQYSYGLNPAPIPIVHTFPTDYDLQSCEADTSASTYHNATCTTPYTYKIVNVAPNGSWSAPSSPVTMTNGAAVLSVDNYNRILWTNDPNVIGTLVYGCHGASCTPTLIHVTTTRPVGEIVATAQYWDDMGNHFGSDEDLGTALPSGARPADLLTQITTINGTNVTLTNAPSQSMTVLMTHDDEPAFAAALLAAQPVGAQPVAKIELPYCSTFYPMAQALSFYGTAGIAFGGQSRAVINNNANASIRWEGPTGGIVFNMNGSAGFTISNLSVPGSPGNTPGLAWSNDNYRASAGPGGNPAGRSVQPLTNGRYEHDSVAQVGIGWTLDDNGSLGNVEDMEWDDFACVNLPTGVGGFACFVGNSTQTDNERFYGGEIGNRDYGWFGTYGHLLIRNVDMGATVIGTNAGGYNNCQVDWEGGQPDAQMLADNTGCIVRLVGLNYEQANGPAGYSIYFAGYGVANTLESNALTGNIATNGQTVSIGNLFSPLSSPWTGTNGTYGGYPLTQFLAPFTTAGGGQGMPRYIEINDTITGVAATGLVSVSAAISLTGTATAGAATCSESMQGTMKVATCYLNAYQETGTAQTATYPAAFSTYPTILEGGSGGNTCGTYNPTSSATVLTLPANAGMSAETCTVTVIGQ